MAVQLDQWEHVVTTSPHRGKYVAMPTSVKVYMDSRAIWAHAHLSAICVYDDDEDWAAVYFTEYTYLDERGTEITRNVDRPENRYVKRVLVSSWSMTSLTFEAYSRNIAGRGLIIIESWQG